MFHMDDPFHDRALTMRRAYHYPFWAIERSAKRWEWRVATTPFDATAVPRKEADRFYRFWQSRLFGDAPVEATRGDFVYVPLQGRLFDHRSFQSCSPLDMIRATLEHEPHLPLIVTLHPNETYTAEEKAALEDLARESGRIRIETGGMQGWLRDCAYVVTQNSSAGFAGYFFGKPLILFAQIDFHHIAANVPEIGAEAAFAKVRDLTPDYAGYIHWFWQQMSINAGHPSAESQIRGALGRAGWPI